VAKWNLGSSEDGSEGGLLICLVFSYHFPCGSIPRIDYSGAVISRPIFWEFLTSQFCSVCDFVLFFLSRYELMTFFPSSHRLPRPLGGEGDIERDNGYKRGRTMEPAGRGKRAEQAIRLV